MLAVAVADQLAAVGGHNFPQWTQKLGQAPPIFSAEINYYLDGLALGQLTPGPVVMLAAFVGYHVAAITGAVVAAAVFLPSFALVALTIPILQRTRQHPWLQAALRGVNPTVIAVIAVALLKMVPVAMPDLPRAALAVVTVLVMLRWSISPPLLIFAGAVLGLASVVRAANGRDHRREEEQSDDQTADRCGVVDDDGRGGDTRRGLPASAWP